MSLPLDNERYETHHCHMTTRRGMTTEELMAKIERRRKRDASWKPGRVQEQVLTSLFSGQSATHTVRQLTYDWPGLTESSVYSAINSLHRRGLVDCRRMEGRERLWELTDEGAAVVRTLDINEDDPFDEGLADSNESDGGGYGLGGGLAGVDTAKRPDASNHAVDAKAPSSTPSVTADRTDES